MSQPFLHGIELVEVASAASASAPPAPPAPTPPGVLDFTNPDNDALAGH